MFGVLVREQAIHPTDPLPIWKLDGDTFYDTVGEMQAAMAALAEEGLEVMGVVRLCPEQAQVPAY